MFKDEKIIKLDIKEQKYPNEAWGIFEGIKVNIKNEIEGRRLEVFLKRKKRGEYTAVRNSIIKRSDIEREEGCDDADFCGGCLYQTLGYEDEIKLKEKMINKLFEGITGNIVFHKPEHIFAYRNKMEYTFSDEKDGQGLRLGLHRRNKFYELVRTDDCNIVHKDFILIKNFVEDYFRKINMTFYHKKRRDGYLRHLVIRRTYFTEEILLNLVSTKDMVFDRDDFVKKLIKQNTQAKIKSIYHTLNDSLSDAIVPEELIHIYGEKYITEELNDMSFEIGPFSFFQTNPYAAEKMYERIKDILKDKGVKVLFDLYSGTGTIAQILSTACKKVYAVEIVEEAVEAAKRTAIRNNVKNVEFIRGDVLKAIDGIKERPDAVVIDPPREGVHPKALKKLIDFAPENIIYVSCNPKTQRRDIETLSENSYEVTSMDVFDNYPRTSHVETVALMSKN